MRGIQSFFKRQQGLLMNGLKTSNVFNIFIKVNGCVKEREKKQRLEILYAALKPSSARNK